MSSANSGMLRDGMGYKTASKAEPMKMDRRVFAPVASSSLDTDNNDAYAQSIYCTPSVNSSSSTSAGHAECLPGGYCAPRQHNETHSDYYHRLAAHKKVSSIRAASP